MSLFQTNVSFMPWWLLTLCLLSFSEQSQVWVFDWRSINCNSCGRWNYVGQLYTLCILQAREWWENLERLKSCMCSVNSPIYFLFEKSTHSNDRHNVVVVCSCCHHGVFTIRITTAGLSACAWLIFIFLSICLSTLSKNRENASHWLWCDWPSNCENARTMYKIAASVVFRSVNRHETRRYHLEQAIDKKKCRNFSRWFKSRPYFCLVQLIVICCCCFSMLGYTTVATYSQFGWNMPISFSLFSPFTVRRSVHRCIVDAIDAIYSGLHKLLSGWLIDAHCDTVSGEALKTMI